MGKSPRSQFELQFVGESPRSQFNSWGGAPIRGEEPQVAVQFVGSIRGEELQFVGKSPQVAVRAPKGD